MSKKFNGIQKAQDGILVNETLVSEEVFNTIKAYAYGKHEMWESTNGLLIMATEERDENLGRFVKVLVPYEKELYGAWEHKPPHRSDVERAVNEYFGYHPEVKPWHSATVNEVYDVVLQGIGHPYQAYRAVVVESSGTLYFSGEGNVPINHKSIVSAERVL